MDSSSGIILIGVIAIGTFALRIVPFIIGKRVKFPPFFLEWLIFISLGVTAGMVSKSLFIRNGVFYFDDLAVQLTAVIIAGLLHWKMRNVLLSLFSGIAAATLMKYFLT